ncbi:MAG: DMT family transporter [Actinobacteria bacterium]|nr:DMT family transporter [Actinomycetota bacterium]
MLGRPLLAGFCGTFAIAFSAIFVRLAHVDPSVAAFFRCFYALPVLGLLAARERSGFGPRSLGERRIAWAAGIFLAADLVLWHYSIDAVGAGLATVLGNTQVVFVGLLAWLFLGERASGSSVAAVPVVFAGVVLISGVVGAGAFGDDPVAGVVYGVGTGISYSIFILVLRKGNQDIRRPAGPLFDATLSGAACSAVAGVATGGLDLVPTWPAHGWLVGLALTSQVLGWLLISVSLPRLQAMTTSLMLTLQPVETMALSAVLLNESPSSFQLGGVGLILLGLSISSLGTRGVDKLEPQAEPV